jgi:uncharacterized membrane protein YraQ (UPF0718 family)
MMQKLVTASNQSRAIFALLLIVLLAVLFWTQSRYPALDEKALMSGAIQLEDPISFEAVLPITPDMPMWKRIAYSTINWLDTNKKGMLFGVLFGAAFLTLFSTLKRRSFQNGYSNSFLGLIIGAPLGVCVNCAAPIAKGLYSSGVRAETALSAMIASPTMNVVVLTMLFSLLPFYMALTKIVFSLVVILLAVPWICRLLPPEQLSVAQPIISDPPQPEGHIIEHRDSIMNALIAFIKSYLANLWFIVRTTVPMMFLAGLLGATAGALFPQDLIMGASFSFGIVILVALIGTFLPVPIAFDVVVAGALLAGGLAQGYVFTLVFTLGTFSAYSFLIVARAISTRAAMLVSGVVAALGIFGGIGVNAYHNWQTDRALEQLLGSNFSLIGAAYAAGTAAPGTVTITPHPFAPRSPSGDAPFTRLEALEVGIDKPLEFSFKDMWPPFWEGRSLTSGDIDHDGDLDLIIASTEVGLYIYLNDGVGQFTRTGDMPLPLAGLDVFNAALVDIDNDGWLDLFVATYLTGNFIIPNVAGQFALDQMQPVENRPAAILSLALSFADVDRDGDLDVALGNWAAGWYRHIPGEESRNRIVFNQGGALTGESYADLPGIPGETLSILLTDIDLDGAADLLVGNDFEVPDYIYMGDGAGGFKALTAQDAIVPHTTNTTMAIKTADLHNDGLPELYFAQIAGRSSGVSETLKMQALSAYCDAVTNARARALCERNMQIKQWYKSGNRFDPSYAHKCNDLPDALKDECRGMLVKDIAIQKNDPSICGLIPVPQTQARAFCDIHFMPTRPPKQSEIAAAIAQVKRSNVLLTRNGPTYEDTAETEGLAVGGWSWDTKIADFDNDGFLDVYIVNGTWVPNEVSPSNLYFRNLGDGTFTEASGPYGLEDYLMTAAATVFDMDHDGDLDIITQPVNGPVIMFRNNAQTGNSIAFELRDQIGNSHGIGARITIRHGGKIQTRELQSGGGFMSYDAPIAFFGLADVGQIDSLTIEWPEGGQTVINQSLQAGATYRVLREN